jgi:hypothetical protein
MHWLITEKINPVVMEVLSEGTTESMALEKP